MTRSLYSNGGVLKSGWVVVNPENTRIIDSNARAEAKLKELALELARQCGEEPEFTEGFTQGINAVEVSELMRDEEGNIVSYEQEDGFTSEQIPEPQPASGPAYEEIIAQAQAEVEEMKRHAVAEIEAMRVQVAEEGRNQGYQDGLEQGRQEGFAQGHQDGLDSVSEAREHALAEVAAKAEKEDYPFASMQKRELIKNTNINIDDVELLEDATLGKNECMIETGSGVFDCSLGTQLEALNEELRLLSYEP